MQTRLTIVLVALMALLSGTSKAAEAVPNFFLEALDGVTLGDGTVSEQLVIFPLIAKKKPLPLSVVAGPRSAELQFAEPEWPARRHNMEVENGDSRPVLLLGGSTLTGGHLDRLVPRDLLLEGKKRIELEVLPAEFPTDRRKEAAALRLARTLAPTYLRERAALDPSRNLVPIFTSHFLEFRDPGDARRSLAAIAGSSTLARYCLVCQEAFATFPAVSEARVVGFVAAVRGRIEVLEVFGSNSLLRSHFAPIVDALTYNAAAIELRAKKLGMPIPGRDDPKRTLAAARAAAEKLLVDLRKARFRGRAAADGTLGESLLIRRGGTRGTALGHEGRLVHAAVYAENPFERALYSRAFAPPTEASGGEEVFGELERREGRGTLTEYEKRLLDRIRRRR